MKIVQFLHVPVLLMAGESNQKWVCQRLTLEVLCNLWCCTSNMCAQKRHGHSRYMTFVEVLIFYQLPTNFLSFIPLGIKDYQRGENLCKSEIRRFSLSATPLPPSPLPLLLNPPHPTRKLTPTPIHA